ncbi:DUF6415 family natural product biosynthesis protein [Streptomyces sp. NPDC090026]|uniref:DUF6415 family natural product biosynthesis protein n=1 Tax=Streptomyces sp. NPDC090026 TaxID=3365923 RepID=UPI003811A178
MTDATAIPDQPPTRQAITLDIAYAQDLAVREPAGESADQVRERLRTAIRALVDDAERYASGLADSRARDIALETVRHARTVAEDPVGNPEANLRLLANAAKSVSRYARPVATA